MPYRADIDGLRAVSVVAVVLYHAGVPWFGGGFVGVDVFFVISGFLITSLILHEQAAGAFSLTSFYHRRIRRILPALFVMMGATAAAGWFLLAMGDAAATPSFVLWGDSHAEMLRAAVGSAASAAGQAGWFAGEKGCAPLIGVTRPEWPLCAEISAAYLRMIVETPAIADVVIAARWGFWSEGVRYGHESGMPPATLALIETPLEHGFDNHATLAVGLERTIAALLAAGKRVWLVGPVPEVGYDVPRYFYLRSLGFARDLEIAPTLAEFDQRQAFVLYLLDDLPRRYPVGVIWPHERLCGDLGCEIARDGHVLYADDDHLSVFGAQSIADLFAPVFD